MFLVKVGGFLTPFFYLTCLYPASLSFNKSISSWTSLDILMIGKYNKISKAKSNIENTKACHVPFVAINATKGPGVPDKTL